MKLMASVLLLVVMLFTMGNSIAEATVPPTVASSAVGVDIYMTNLKDTDVFTCSGTLITEVLVLTAYHCVEKNPFKIVVHTFLGAQSTATFYRAEKGLDLALLHLDEALPPALAYHASLAVAPPVLDTPVVVLGCPDGTCFEFFHGSISRIYDDIWDNKNDDFGKATHEFYDLQTLAVGGESGAGVFDIDGNLIGVFVGGVGPTKSNQEWGIAVGWHAVRAFLYGGDPR